MSGLKQHLKNNRIVRAIYYRLSGIVKKKYLETEANKMLEKFEIKTDGEERKSLIADMIRVYSRHGFWFDEYLCYHFDKLKEKEIVEFTADWEHLGYACTLNNYKNDALFDNKVLTYEKYKKYYNRVMLYCKGESAREKFDEFAASNKSFVVKPLNLSCGRGIKIIKDSISYDDLSAQYDGEFIVEELIEQVDEMAKLHPQSVNTVRVPTIRLDDEVVIVHPFMRIGQNGNVVDNGGAGGIICAVNVEEGTIFAAADENGKVFETHPNSGEKIIGFKIPKWEEAKKLVRELACVTPSNRYTGWDIALTNDGWIVVEANRRGQFLWQIPEQKGFRKEMNEILKKLGKKY